MSRATNSPATRQRRNRVLKRAKGFRQRRGNLFRIAKETTLRADAFSFAASTAALCIRSPKSPLRRSEAAIAVIRGVNVTDRSSSKVIATGGTAAGFLV